MTVTRKLAEHLEHIDFFDIPSEVIEHTKLCFLDWLGCAIGGSLEPAGRIANELIMSIEGTGEATILGAGNRTCSLNAAFVNGVFGHTLELDDIHEESIIHPAAPVVPAALAICEREGLSGAHFLSAIVSGYEAEIRIAAAMAPNHYRYWHTTGTCGTFGAAAAAGKLLRLTTDELVHAFGLAATQASGLIEVFGSMAKPLNAGKAAMNGVLASFLANRGFTSSQSILEGEKGYCRATSDQFSPESILEEPEAFRITGNVFKQYSCCGHMHGALDALLGIIEEHHIQAEDVKKVRVGVYPIALEIVGKRSRPKSASEARFNLPFCIALALLYRRVGPAEFAANRIFNDRVFKLSRRVEVEEDSELSNARLGAGAVLLELMDGTTIEKRTERPKGHPGNPLSTGDLERKFRNLAISVLKEDEISSLLTMVRGLEDLPELDRLLELTHTESR